MNGLSRENEKSTEAANPLTWALVAGEERCIQLSKILCSVFLYIFLSILLI